MQHHCTLRQHVCTAVFKSVYILLLMPVCRLWGFSPALACSCWLPPHSSFWPLPLCSAASASAAKATTTLCQPKHAVGAGAESRFTDDQPSFFSFSTLLGSLPPTSFERFIFFGLSLHQPQPLRDPSLCMREAW